MRTSLRRGARGVSLLELIITIVIVGISLVSVLSVFIVTTQHSADPLARQQALFIAEAYLEEILRQKFYDPDTDNVCPSPEGGRSSFDNVCDYRNISAEAPTNAAGSAISGLGAYQVTVTVTRDGSFTLNALDNASVVRVMRVDVSVTKSGESITLTGYRTNYNCNVSGDAGCKAL